MVRGPLRVSLLEMATIRTLPQKESQRVRESNERS